MSTHGQIDKEIRFLDEPESDLDLLRKPKANIQKQLISRSILSVHKVHALGDEILPSTLGHHNDHMATVFEPFLDELKEPSFSFKVEW